MKKLITVSNVPATAVEVVKCLSPLIVILIVYSLFRFFVPELYEGVHYSLMPHADSLMFGTLPTQSLQHWLWHGYVTWYDYVLYIIYNLHYILPVFLAVVIYKFRREHYLRFATTFLTTTFSAFIFFVAYPSAPPWLASDNSYIPHITRIFDAVYSSMGIQDFSTLYNRYAPNPVAALPSLHAAYAVLFSLFIYKVFGKKWAALSLLYPILLSFGVVYMGEHYVIDVIAGVGLAAVSYALAPGLVRLFKPSLDKIAIKLSVAAIGSHRE